MRRLTLVFLGLIISLSSLAQTDIMIDLEQWKGKRNAIPFTISSVIKNVSNPTKVGEVYVGKKKWKTVRVEESSELMVQKFIEKNFKQGKAMDIQLEITTLRIKPAEIKGKPVQHFMFSCKFYKNGNSLSDALYSFNASNSITTKKSLKLAMTNYMSRVLTSAILNFKKSFSKHPEWQKENINTPDIKMHKRVYFNFVGIGDTIALKPNYKLSKGDFAGIAGKRREEDAFSNFIMSYRLQETERDNNIYLKIYAQAVFLRSRSWTKEEPANPKWLEHQQLLFDLATYHAQLFEQALQDKKYTAGYYKAEINQIYNDISIKYFDEMDDLQADTKFGTDAAKEEIWKKKVDRYLGRIKNESTVLQNARNS